MFERVSTIGDQVYKTLRHEIIEMRIKPGEKLSEIQIAEKFNVSRAPVRDAIRRLQQEKLVLVKPQIGTIVSEIFPEQASDICEVRLLLEPYATFVATDRISEDDIGILKVAFDRMLTLPEGSDDRIELIVSTDAKLHKTIWVACNNKEIDNILTAYLDQKLRIQLATMGMANRLIPSEHEMRQIFEALMERNAELARDAMHTHIFNIKRAIAEVMKGS
ncbi:MAG: GntR family transcriptional regulator [Syntrophales bacterium]